MKHTLTKVVLAAATCLSVACSSFERDWKRAVQERPARTDPGAPPGARAGADGAAVGPWVGTWRSESTGHTGALRCLVRQPDAPDLGSGAWEFRYHARWGMLGGEFKTAQPVQAGRAGRFVSQGAWTLPAWAGGTYHYDIEIADGSFRGTYRSTGDHGTFSMKRPVAP